MFPPSTKRKRLMQTAWPKKAKNLNKRLDAFKNELLQQSDALYAVMEADANVRTGEKGNYSIISFDGLTKVEISVQNRIEITEEMSFAKAKFKEYEQEILKDVKDHEVTLFINNAFKMTNGKLDVRRIIDLINLNIKHPLFKEARELAIKGMHSKASKRYARIWITDDNGEMKAIELNFSSL